MSLCIVGIVLWIFPPGLARAENHEITRDIIAFYDDLLYQDIFHTSLHQMAEMPLNYLGMKLTYRGITRPLPTESELVGVRGFITWFDGSQKSEVMRPVCEFLSRQIDAGRKVVVLGGFERIKSTVKRPSADCMNVYRRLGVEYGGEFADDPFFIEVLSKDADVVEFERKLLFTEGLEYVLLKPVSPDIKKYLMLKRTDLAESASALVFTSPAGGIAHFTFASYVNKGLGKRQWRLNPFYFFEEAFRLQGLPRPDPTTLNGRRIFFSHIDGDGIFNLSLIDRKSYSGEIILQEILKRYESLPITVSLITGYFKDPQFHGKRELDLYRAMFSLPNIEAASHGYAHPLVWKSGKVALKIPGYKMDARREITGSVQDMNQLLAELGTGQSVELFQWTGDCLPSDDDAQAAAAGKILTINGGDSRFDREHDSVSFVSPLGIFKGGTLQVYTGAPNENVYTNLWQGPYHGYRDVLQSFVNTEAPRRLKPINVYYHFYSAEKAEALAALRAAYDFALTQKIAPIRTSDYVRQVQDFFSIRMEEMAPGEFRLSGKGILRTVRFDNETRVPDLSRSVGVIGYKEESGRLYVHLDESRVHTLILGKNPAQDRVFLESASGFIQKFMGDDRSGSFQTQSWLAPEIILRGLKPHQEYSIRSGAENRYFTSDDAGRLVVKLTQSNGGKFSEITYGSDAP